MSQTYRFDRRCVGIFLLGAACLLLYSDSASAQRRWYGYRGYGGVNPGYFGGPMFGFSGNFASTAAEGRARGFADVVRSAGDYNLKSSEAAINAQEARSKYIENQKRWTEVYWERKRLAQAEREKDYDKARARRDKYLSSKERSSRPSTAGLTPSQLDPNTGKIDWPTPLTDPQFASYRKELDELFVMRAQSQTVPGLDAQVKQTTDEMLALVNDKIQDMSPSDYVTSRKFLDGLASTVE